MISFKPQNVCSTEIQFDIEEGKLKNVKFIGGCRGNLNAISILVENMPVEEVIRKLRGNQCRNETSCADQLARALEAQLHKAC